MPIKGAGCTCREWYVAPDNMVGVWTYNGLMLPSGAEKRSPQKLRKKESIVNVDQEKFRPTSRRKRNSDVISGNRGGVIQDIGTGMKFGQQHLVKSLFDPRSIRD